MAQTFNEYLNSLDVAGRKRSLKLAKEQEKKMVNIYHRAAEDYYEKFLMAKDGTATKALYAEYTKEMANKIEGVIKEYSIKGAENSLQVAKAIMEDVGDKAGLKDTPFKDAVNKITNATASKAAERVIRGEIYKDGKGLSSRIWKTVNNQAQDIQEVIAVGMAQQLSAVELSKVLESFLKPGANNVWNSSKVKKALGPAYASWNKNISYNAMRLARTTLSHSATMAIKESAKVNPYISSAKWHSVHAVGRTCDECKERDGKVYKLNVMPYDHPNGLCWHETIIDKTMGQMVKELKDWTGGKPNATLDTWWKTTGMKLADKPLSALAKVPDVVRPKTTTTKKATTVTNEPVIRDDAWFDENFERMKSELPEKHWLEIKKRMKEAPEFMQDYLQGNERYFTYDGKDRNGRGAYYSPGEKLIRMDLDKDANEAFNGRYSVFFHEYGHMIDDRLRPYGKMVGVASRDKDFIATLKEDYQDLITKAKTIVKRTGGDPEDKARVARTIKKFQEDAGDHMSAGAQDIISGLSLNKHNHMWGHSNDYWKRDNIDHEVASEAWANMSSAHILPEVGEQMVKLFPKSMKKFESIVKEYNKLVSDHRNGR